MENFNSVEFKRWCKENGKNPAFTKNMLEFMKLEIAQMEKVEEKICLQDLLDMSKNDTLNEKVDNVILIKNRFENKGIETMFMAGGIFNRDQVARNVLVLVDKLMYGSKNFGEGANVNFENEDIEMFMAALDVVMSMLSKEKK